MKPAAFRIGLLALVLGGCATDTTPVYGKRLDLERGCWRPPELVGFISADADVFVETLGVGQDPDTGDVHLFPSATYIELLGWDDCALDADRCDVPEVESPAGAGYPDCEP